MPIETIAELRNLVVQMAAHGQEGHVPSSLSILDLVWAIYDEGFVTESNDSKFVLSKGHGCLALYVTLAKKKYFPESWLRDFATFSSPLGGHPDSTQVPGVEASTGSLGHGLPFSCGLAYAEKLKGSAGKIFVLVGDGESNEGSVWESALLAAHRKLDNLVCIIDNNKSSSRAMEMGDFGSKFKSFGWDSVDIDGHDNSAIKEALALTTQKPLAIVATTVKGKGIEEMEDNPAWHHTKISPEDLKRFTLGAK